MVAPLARRFRLASSLHAPALVQVGTAIEASLEKG